MSKLQWKWAGLLGLLAMAGVFLYPSVNWYSMQPQERERLEANRLRPRWLLNLGLDLKGGTHLLMELDAARLPPEADLGDALSRAIEVIRNRVDQFGVAEPLIARQGERWIVVQLPGITNSRQAKELIGKTALLEFRMEDASEAAQTARQKIAESGDPFDKDGNATPAAQALLPKGTQLLRGREVSFHVVRTDIPLTGAQLDSAKVEPGPTGVPVVAFKFKSEGAKAFADLTSANVGKNLAIVLDNVVYSAPVIKGPIRGGSGIIEGNFTTEEARKLAIVLRSGALPAPVRIIEERTVGASLGEDSIKAGLSACAAGALLIALFMIVYYRLSGLMANLTLLVNLVLLTACMAYFGSTLTLPGIAGIVLTMGMAIDANVLIFERIREELRAGKPVRIATEAGYEKAAAAILDSNVTTIIAAAMLFQFGTGPIKGFAVTLTLGNLICIFTATVVNRLMHQAWLSNRDVQTLSI